MILKKSSLCSELAKFADVVWNARNGKKTVVAAVFRSDPIGDEAIAAEETQLWSRLCRPAPFTTRRLVARAGAAVGPSLFSPKGLKTLNLNQKNFCL